MSDLLNLTIKQQNKLIKESKISSKELVEETINHVKKYDREINSIINFDENVSIFQKSVGGERNCLTKIPKLIFRKNQIFPMCKILSFCQIFWNYGKSRSQLRESLDKLLLFMLQVFS